MSDLLAQYYLWIKALHVIAVIAWMAGLFYLPRLFIYHNDADPKNVEQIETFKLMEMRLLKVIMNNAMLATWFFGILMVMAGLINWGMVWPWIKLVCVLAMTWFHMWLSKQRRLFETGEQVYSTKTYRLMNEVPTLIMFVIVIMAIVEPF